MRKARAGVRIEMKNVWVFALLLSAMLGGGAIVGVVAMDAGESPDYVSQDDVIEETTSMGDDVCGMEGDMNQYRYMQGELDKEQTRLRQRDQDPTCDQEQLREQERLRDRQQNRTHDGECERQQLKQGDQDGEQYQYKYQNGDVDGEYKFNHRWRKHVGVMP